MGNYSAIIDNQYKDEMPSNTVNRIKNLLKTYGIETNERWIDSHVPNCYSLRIDAKGTIFGSNGKGVTKDLALASGYGEFIERLQVGRLSSGKNQKGAYFAAVDSQSEMRPMAELLKNNRKWYEAYVDEYKQITGKELTVEEVLKQYVDSNGNIPTTPFYSATTEQMEYLPTALVRSIYSTNGCAAGNTPEEAIVQAISEIVERHQFTRIIYEDIPLPEVPEETLKSCKIAYEMVSFLRDNGYRVIIKDGSLGMGFPVVCVCLINQATGKYNTHFGAYPVFEIALERSLTECFQGRSLDNIAKYEDFCYNKEERRELRYAMNQLVKGTSEQVPSFFIDASEKEFQECSYFTGKNNKELLAECIKFIRNQGFDVLIHNYSCLGFPTYQVIAPGYSEIYTHRLVEKYSDMRYLKYARKALKDPSAAQIEDILGFMKHLSEAKKWNISDAVFFSEIVGIHAKLNPEEENYFMLAALAYFNYSMRNYSASAEYIKQILLTEMDINREYLVCLRRCLLLTVHKYSTEEISRILHYFHREETVRELYGYIKEGKNPLEQFVLRCDSKCSKECHLINACNQKKMEELASLIEEKMNELNQMDVVKLFSCTT